MSRNRNGDFVEYVDEYNSPMVCVAPDTFVDIRKVASWHLDKRSPECQEKWDRYYYSLDKINSIKTHYKRLPLLKRLDLPTCDNETPVVIVFKDGHVEKYAPVPYPDGVGPVENIMARLMVHQHTEAVKLKEAQTK